MVNDIPIKAESYIASIPTSVPGYDELVRKTRSIFAAAQSAVSRHTVPISNIGIPTLADVVLDDCPSMPEAIIEEKLLHFLAANKGYERLDINDEESLVDNFRKQISAFNEVVFTDAEWKRFLDDFAKGNKTCAERTRAVYSGIDFTHDDGHISNIWFQTSDDPDRNIFQVLHQMRGTDTSGRNTRYDVTILVNGLPRVHFELKRQNVGIAKAFGQIDRYVSTSFLNSEYKLYEFVSLFVISNGTDTRYYANTVREGCRKAHKSARQGKMSRKDKTAKLWANTFEWKTTGNLELDDIISFADSFCDRVSLSYILTDYCTITVDDDLFVGKSYQIAAVEAMFNKVISDFSQGRMNGSDANGYIWHATGSGKTFTSFLTAKLLARHIGIRTNFMVDRKDLDSQTVREYNRFDRDCVSTNKNSRSMKKKLDDIDQMLVVGIINKMSRIVSKETAKSRKAKTPLPAFFYLPTVFIFDECHRTQFGNMQVSIQKTFKCYIEFGITGTPIFEQNKHAGSINSTTANIFGEELHRYSITSAIADKAVLPYRIHTVPSRLLSLLPDDLEAVPEPTKVYTCAPARIMANAEFIAENHADLVKASGPFQVLADDMGAGDIDAASGSAMRSIRYDFREHFNAILACDSIPMASAYYAAFKSLSKEKKSNLKIAMIYTSPVIEEDDSIEDDIYSMSGVKAEGRQALESAIDDYNAMFSTSFSLTADSFPKYYESVSDKMKSADVDLLIVVNMFLTGFDAPCVNTLYLDKPLKWHTLIQAMGRTCRTCDAVKQWGEIVCFRDMEQDMKQAFALYGGAHAFEQSTVESYDDILIDYIEADRILRDALAGIRSNPHVSIADKADYIAKFASARILRGKLAGYFSRDCNFDDDIERNGLIADSEWMTFQSKFVDYRNEIESMNDEEDTAERDIVDALPDDVEFVSELIDQYQIDVEWLLSLIEDYQSDPGIGSDKYPLIVDTVNRQFAASSSRNLIMPWIEVLWTTNGRKAKDAYMRREYGNMVKEMQRNYPDADKKMLAAFIAESIRNEEASSDGEKAKNLFPSKGIKNRRKYRKVASALVDDVRSEVDKWIQIQSVFVGCAPWEKQ